MNTLKILIVAILHLIGIIAFSFAGVLLLKIVYDFIVHDNFFVKHLIWIGYCLIVIVVSIIAPPFIKVDE